MTHDNNWPVKVYKVTGANGEAIHRESDAPPFLFSLPSGDTPGNWHEAEGPLRLCRNGIHVTDEPARWWKPGARVFEIEIDGERGEWSAHEHKGPLRKMRLVRELVGAELATVRIAAVGEHVAKEGHWIAIGSARVVAWGSSRVEAWESSSVEAWEWSSVVAREWSSVVARGSSSVVAREWSSVVAWEWSSVVARGSSRVEAWESSSVVAWGSSRVDAYDTSTIIATWGAATVVTNDRAVFVDQRGDKPVIRCATDVDIVRQVPAEAK